MSCRNSPREPKRRLVVLANGSARAAISTLGAEPQDWQRRREFPHLAGRSGLVAESKARSCFPSLAGRAMARCGSRASAIRSAFTALPRRKNSTIDGALARERAPAPRRQCGDARALPFRLRARGRVHAFADEPCGELHRAQPWRRGDALRARPASGLRLPVGGRLADRT